jgi:U32 family peptidase
MNKKTSKAKKPAKKAAKKAPKEKLVGKVSHYFDKIGVAAIKLSVPLKKGDTVRIEGGSVSVKQKVASMQKEHEPVSSAKKGDEVGIKVSKKVREGYRVFLS